MHGVRPTSEVLLLFTKIDINQGPTFIVYAHFFNLGLFSESLNIIASTQHVWLYHLSTLKRIIQPVAGITRIAQLNANLISIKIHEIVLTDNGLSLRFPQVCLSVVYLPSLCSAIRASECARKQVRGGRYLGHIRFY